MSLLLEALKKAEKAKEEAQRRAKGDPAAPDLRVESEPPLHEKPVLTRAELPDIRQPLEILTEEIAPRQPEPVPQGQASDEPQAADRATARKVFEAKFREPNPRLQFHDLAELHAVPTHLEVEVLGLGGGGSDDQQQDGDETWAHRQGQRRARRRKKATSGSAKSPEASSRTSSAPLA